MANKPTPELYEEYVTHMRKIADVKYASALLQWDQETYLPPKGASIRGRQIASLTEIAHQHFTDDGLGNMLQELLARDNLSATEKSNVQLTWEDYSKQKKYTSGFVRRLTEAVHKSFHSWIEARRSNDFGVFEDSLDTVVQFKREEANLLGYRRHPYDALLNEHDKGSDVQLLDGMFQQMKKPLKDLLDNIQASAPVANDFLYQFYPREKQWEFGMHLLKDLGFDFDAGRQDISEHPFTVNFNSNDVRITTRINEQDCSSMIWSCIHELGHAFYEQGLPERQYGLPLSEPVSYSIHESQSRLWENHVGRSKAFCSRYFPLLQDFFSDQLRNVSTDEFYYGINKVQPSLIRTEADELTYHFHIVIRYEIEKLLIENSITTKDIPSYWNDHYRRYLDIIVPDDKRGCLQDVHWSHGSFGYFPTYSQGSFYAAQLYSQAEKTLPDMSTQITLGNTRPLLDWLKKQVYQHGRRFTSEELCLTVSGEGLNTEYFLGYLLEKYRIIYKF